MADSEDFQQDEQQAAVRHELEDADGYSQYLLHSKTEILFLMRALIQKGAMITVYFDHGKSFLLTSLLATSSDNNFLYFDYGSSQEMNNKATQAERLMFTTALDKVKIQFSLKQLEKTDLEGKPAFRGAIPDTVLRLQRREYYRLETPIASPLKCLLPVLQSDGTANTLETTLLDISGGGIGIATAPAQAQQFATGTTFYNCKISIPDEGELIATLVVRNSFSVTTKTGSNYLRVGFEFVNLPGTRLSMIQRYITRIERERKARVSGLG